MEFAAGWVGWSREFRDQLCLPGLGNEKRIWPLCDTSPRYFYDIHGSITRGKLAPIQFNRCSFGVFCLSTVDHLMYERLIWVNLQILPVDPPIRRYAIELYFVVDYCSGRD